MVRKMSVPSMELTESDGPNTQLCAVMDGIGEISVKRALIPEPSAGEVRVKVKWVGICGSDVEVFRGAREPEFITYPIRLGHEVAGVIDKVGEDVIGIKVGDHVTLRYVWGAFAEYVCCIPFAVKVIPKDFPLIEGSLIEVLPPLLHTAELGQISPNKNVLIMGQGVSGLAMTQVGAALFIGSAIGKIPVEKCVKALLPFYLCMLIVTLLVAFIPPIVMFVPNLFK